MNVPGHWMLHWTLVCPWVHTVTWSLEIRVGALAQENRCQWVLMDAPPSASATQTRIHSLPSMLTPNCRFSEDINIIKQDQWTVWLSFCLQSNNKSHEKDKPRYLIQNRNLPLNKHPTVSGTCELCCLFGWHNMWNNNNAMCKLVF